MNFVRTLTLRQLQIFAVAARHLSYARAAEELHLTPPALSMHLKPLEDNVGLPLFERMGRGVALTGAGELLLHHALRVLGEIKDAEANLMAMASARNGSFNIASGRDTSFNAVAAALLQACKSALQPEYNVDAATVANPVEARRVISREKARRDLGWEPRVDIEEGMRRLVAWLDEDARRRSHAA